MEQVVEARRVVRVDLVVVREGLVVLKDSAEVPEGVMRGEKGAEMSGIIDLWKENPRLFLKKKLQPLKSTLTKSGIKRPRKLVKIKFMRGRMIRMSSLGKIKVILAMRLLMLFVIPPIWLRIGWHVRIVGSSTIPPETVEG